MFQGYSEKIRRTNLKVKQIRQVHKYSCDICVETNWLSETDVELHRKAKHFKEIREQSANYKNRFCTVCMKLHESQKALIAHIKTRHLLSSATARRVERQIFICNYCNNIFFNKDMLEVHIMNYHLWPHKDRSSKTFLCPKCKRMRKLKSIWFHLQLHEIPSMSICDICLTNFGNLKELEEHMKSHQIHYKCDICNYETLKDYQFESHLDGHHRARYDKTVDVSKLERKMFRRYVECTPMSMRYNIHHSLKGVDIQCLIICVLCRELCNDKAEARAHLIRDHLKKEESKRPCTCLCGEEFFNKVLLRHHVFKMRGEHRQLGENEEPRELPPTIDYIDVDMPPGYEDQGVESTQIQKIQSKNVKRGGDMSFMYAEVNGADLVTIVSDHNEEVFGL